MSVRGPPGPQICGTRTFDEWTASTIPVSRTSCLARGGAEAIEAAMAVGGLERVQEAIARHRMAVAISRWEQRMRRVSHIRRQYPRKG